MLDLKASATGEYDAVPLPPHLDRPGELPPVVEAEAHDEMGHLRPGPIGEEEVERLQLREVVGPLAPAFGEIGVAPPVEIAHVGKRQNVAVERTCRLPRHVRSPIAVGGRRDRAPPEDHSGERQGKEKERAPARPGEQRDDRRERAESDEAAGRGPGPFRRRQPEPQRRRRPRAERRDDQHRRANPKDRRSDRPRSHRRPVSNRVPADAPADVSSGGGLRQNPKTRGLRLRT